MKIYLLSLFLFLIGNLSYGQSLPKGAVQIGPTIRMIQSKNPYLNEALIREYVSKQSRCLVSEHNEQSAYVQCDGNKAEALLAGLSIIDASVVLLGSGFNQEKADGFFFGD